MARSRRSRSSCGSTRPKSSRHSATAEFCRTCCGDWRRRKLPANDYHFITTWRLAGTTCEEVSDVLGNAEDLARWWPDVYLKVTELEHGDARGVGKRVRLFTKGRLPYRLRWEFVITESRKPNGFTLVASGDFVGRGIWTFAQQGGTVVATYDWKIIAEKGLLKNLSAIFKPVFSWNHHWAMARGEESLRRELARRRT